MAPTFDMPTLLITSVKMAHSCVSISASISGTVRRTSTPLSMGALARNRPRRALRWELRLRLGLPSWGLCSSGPSTDLEMRSCRLVGLMTRLQAGRDASGLSRAAQCRAAAGLGGQW